MLNYLTSIAQLPFYTNSQSCNVPTATKTLHKKQPLVILHDSMAETEQLVLNAFTYINIYESHYLYQ